MCEFHARTNFMIVLLDTVKCAVSDEYDNTNANDNMKPAK